MKNRKKKDLIATFGPGAMNRPSRPRPSERSTRAPAVFWDRIKFLLLLGLLWLCGLAVVWTVSVNPLGGPFSDAVRLALHDYAWILVLAALEIVRQLHYFVEENWKGYYRFWQKVVWEGGSKRLGGILSDWTRYRVSRALKTAVVLLAVSTFLGRLFHSDPVWLGIVEAPARLVVALPFILQFSFAFFFIAIQFVGLFWFLSRGGMDLVLPDEIETRFTDVKGQDSVLQRVKEAMVFLEDPESIEDRGGYVPNGILLWGPPGTGKTLMAKAIAGESARPFMLVDTGALSGMFMGVGVLRVRSLYRKLRKLALRYGGVIVFFDEADSLGSRGMAMSGLPAGMQRVGDPWVSTPACNGITYVSPVARDAIFSTSLPAAVPGTSSSPREQFIFGGGMGGGGFGTLQALLTAMSGLEKPRGLMNKVRKMLGMKAKPPPKYRILHIFATNMPTVLDQALLRPGRIDRKYKVGFPHKLGRKETFEYYLAKVKNDLTPEQVDKLATITPYKSGADIQDIVNEGLVVAIDDGRDVVTYRDILKAKQHKEYGLPDDHEYIERERHSVAVHEACHAVVAYRLRKHAVIDMVTIERRGDVGGFVASIPPEDQFVEWRSERDIDVMTFLASLVGERLFYEGDNSAGVGGDMRGATALATLMEGY